MTTVRPPRVGARVRARDGHGAWRDGTVTAGKGKRPVVDGWKRGFTFEQVQW
eukprot:gene43013-17171_t